MRGSFKLCNATYWFSLTIWVAAIFGAGVAAMGVFSTLPDLGLTMQNYELALGDNTREHGRFAGGMVMEPIFTATDFVQAIAAFFVVIMLALQLTVFKMRWSTPSNLLRTIAIASAAALVAVHMIAFAPRMNNELRSAWRAAEMNDVAAMNTHRVAFEADHRTANRLYNVRFILLLVAVAASGVALTPHKPTFDQLQTPALLKRS